MDEAWAGGISISASASPSDQGVIAAALDPLTSRLGPMRSVSVRRSAGQQLRPWLAMIASRDVRGRMIAILLLGGVLVAGLMACLTQQPRGVVAPVQAEWTTLPRPLDLPGKPDAEGAGAMPTPPPIVGLEAAERNASTPFASLGSAAKPFHFVGSPQDRARAQTCLAAAMLYEAGDDALGQLAVAQVVLNRVRHPAFPASVCGVVLQGSERATGCQFTFTCDGALARAWSPAKVLRARSRADAMLDGLVFAGVGLATHYHTDLVYPWWSPKLQKIAPVGSHLFFRWPGVWGSSRAMQGKGQGAEPSAALFASLGVITGQVEAMAPRIESEGDVLATGTSAASPGGLDLRSAKSDVTPSVPLSRRLITPATTRASPVVIAGTPILGGHRLLRTDPERGVYFLQLTPGWAEAQARRTAAALCGGRSVCHVYGWTDAGQVPTSTDMADAVRAAPAFRYVRESAPRAPSNAPVAQIF